MGARLRCAWPTIATICANRVSFPTRSARMMRAPVSLIVPPMTRSPAVFWTGIGSPVIMDSLTELWPSTTTPSTGIFSPGRIRSLSPTCTWSRDTSSSEPFGNSRRAVLGASPRRDLIAAPVRLRARSSRTWPSRTNAVMTAAASK